MSTLTTDSKIYVAGHRGLVGSAIKANLERRGFRNVIGRSHAELDLLDPVATDAFIAAERPDAVVLAAAHVGGIMANSTHPADFIYQNLQIQQNVIGSAFRHGVRRLLFLGSSCIYPRMAPQPIPEDALLTSSLEYTNEAYALAKIAGLKLCESLNLQYGTDYVAVMPTNLYGPNDNFDLTGSHVLPAMIRKYELARLLGEGDMEGVRADLRRRPDREIDADTATDAEIEAFLGRHGIYRDRLELWGTGTPLREFLWSEDMADACVHILLNVPFSRLRELAGEPVRNTHVNIGTGVETTIAALAATVADAVGYRGDTVWDATKPDGTPRKLCDVSRLHSLGWHHAVELPEGVRRLVGWYRTN